MSRSRSSDPVAGEKSSRPEVVYLDHAAGTAPRPVILNGHGQRGRRLFYNPHATNPLGAACQEMIGQAEDRVLALLGTDRKTAGIIWTSGGTEANNLAILGLLRACGGPDRACAIEATAHSSLLKPAQQAAMDQSGTMCRLDVTSTGRLAPMAARLPAELARQIILTGVCHVNNESGVIQDLLELRSWMDAVTPQSYLLVDGLQSFTKMRIPWQEARIDLLSLGGRKFGGPPAVGALIYRRGTPLQPILFGGDQQESLRPGTMDTVGIVEFAAAASRAAAQQKTEQQRIVRLNNFLRQELQKWQQPALIFISPPDASPYILNIALPGLEGVRVARAMAEKKVIISTGSACSTLGAGAISHVLQAMGIARPVAAAALRISLGWNTRKSDINRLLNNLRRVVTELT